MIRRLLPLLLLAALNGSALAQQPEPSPTPQKRGWLSRILPFGRKDELPEYKDPQLRGLILSLQLAPQPVRLSETRQMQVNIRLTNKAKRPITLEFPNTQRFEIYLLNTAGKVLTAWSDNHSVIEEPSTIMINPEEHIEYRETIATRELTPNKVYVCEVFFPKYRDLCVQQKFMAAP